MEQRRLGLGGPCRGFYEGFSGGLCLKFDMIFEQVRTT